MGSLGQRVTRRVVGMDGNSLSGRARVRRYELLVQRFPQLPEMRVLDLGGEPHTWRGAEIRPRELVLLNLESQVTREYYTAGDDASWMRIVAGDACAPPAELRGESFDLVFSNSVIEHVGGHQQRCAFAQTVREFGEHYWIQTPNRYFPIEPHWVFPGFQFLPKPVAARASLHWPIGNYAGRGWTYERAIRHVESVELLSARDLCGYFPGATLMRERWGGMTKSLIATR